MSIDKSLKRRRGGSSNRSVLTRAERIQKLQDLEKWTDMITVNGYPDAKDADALAEKANAVLDNYKKHRAMVLKTDSVPRTDDREAEHFIAVAFPRPSFVEIVFARFKLVDGEGCSVVHSHRIYGKKAGDEASAWLKTNGQARQKTLMEWKAIPSSASLRKELLRTRS